MSTPQRIVVLGSTGSVGRQTLEVVEANPERFTVVGLAARGGNVALLNEQIRRFGPSVVAWRRHGAIPRRIKFIAIGMMTLSFIVVAIAHPPSLWFWVTAAVLLACALFVATRPEGPKTTG